MNNWHLERLFYAHLHLAMLLCMLMAGAAIEAAFEEAACGSTVMYVCG